MTKKTNKNDNKDNNDNNDNNDNAVMKKVGTRIEVMHGKAIQTGGGLKKSDLKLNKGGGIVSVRASNAAKKTNNLVGAGYVTKKGEFGSVYVGGDKKKSKHKSPTSPKSPKKEKKDKKDKITFF
jgi:hypothetical protein